MTVENATRVIIINSDWCKNPKEHNTCEKNYIWNFTTCICENI